MYDPYPVLTSSNISPSNGNGTTPSERQVWQLLLQHLNHSNFENHQRINSNMIDINNLNFSSSSSTSSLHSSASTTINSSPNNNSTRILFNKVASLINQTVFNQSNFHSFHDIVNGKNHGYLIADIIDDSDDNSQQMPREEEKEMSLWIKLSFYMVYVLIFLLGILGNVIVCYVVARKTSMHTVTNVFIANLALSDILLCLFAVPFTPLYLITFKSWIFGQALCHLVPFAQGVSVYISAFTLMSIAIDRYFVILQPFRPRMKMKTCIFIIIAIWKSAIILTFPYAHFMELIEHSDGNTDDDDDYGDGGDNNKGPDSIKTYTTSSGSSSIKYYCNEQWPHEELSKMFGITTTALQFVIPFVIITFCYVKICAKLSDRAKAIPGNVSARREEQERERTRKTNGMLISMVVIFVISWLPMNMFNLLADFYQEATEWRYQSILFLISHAIAMSSTCYNPFLYAWLNDNFRKEFKEVLPCIGWIQKTPTPRSTLVELRHRSSNNTNNNNNNDNSVQQNTPRANTNSSTIFTKKNDELANSTNSSIKLIKLCSKDGDTKLEVIRNSAKSNSNSNNNNKNGRKINNVLTGSGGNCSINEARQSLITKNELQVSYNGCESTISMAQNSNASSSTSSSNVTESSHSTTAKSV